MQFITMIWGSREKQQLLPSNTDSAVGTFSDSPGSHSVGSCRTNRNDESQMLFIALLVCF